MARADRLAAAAPRRCRSAVPRNVLGLLYPVFRRGRQLLVRRRAAAGGGNRRSVRCERQSAQGRIQMRRAPQSGSGHTPTAKSSDSPHLAAEWAFARHYLSEEVRRAALLGWLRTYIHYRQHTPSAISPNSSIDQCPSAILSSGLGTLVTPNLSGAPATRLCCSAARLHSHGRLHAHGTLGGDRYGQNGHKRGDTAGTNNRPTPKIRCVRRGPFETGRQVDA